MSKKQDMKLIQRIEKLWPDATTSEVDDITNVYKSYMRSGFDVKRITRLMFRIFIVIIPLVAAQTTLSAIFFDPGSTAERVSLLAVIFCSPWLCQTSFAQNYLGRDDNQILASIITERQNRRESNKPAHPTAGDVSI